MAFEKDAKESGNDPYCNDEQHPFTPPAMLRIWGELDDVCETGQFRKVKRRYVEYVRSVLTLTYTMKLETSIW